MAKALVRARAIISIISAKACVRANDLDKAWVSAKVIIRAKAWVKAHAFCMTTV